MKNKGILFFVLFDIVLLAAVLLFVLLYLPLQQHNRQLQAQIEILHGDNADLKTTIYELKRRLTNLDNERNDLLMEKRLLEELKQNLLTNIESSEEERIALKQRLDRQQQQIQRLKTINDELAARFQVEMEAGDISIKRVGDRLILDVSNELLFEPGSAELNQRGIDILHKVADVVKDLDSRLIQVGGHTDDQPIYGNLKNRYPTNWELSAARAINVVKLLEAQGVDPTLLYAAGFGPYQPLTSNTSEEGRKINRRIDIQLLPNPETLEELAASILPTSPEDNSNTAITPKDASENSSGDDAKPSNNQSTPTDPSKSDAEQSTEEPATTSTKSESENLDQT
jgi:chemotaxis protein MotB